MRITPDHLRAALALDPFDEEAAREHMTAKPRSDSGPRPWRDGAVLLCVYPGPEGLTLPLTRRTGEVEYHRGQISLPGGAREDGESMLEAALREAEEEVGLPAREVEILGRLPILRIPPSGFRVRPFVGILPRRPALRPDPREVAGLLEVPLALLLEEDRVKEEERDFHGRRMRIPYYDLPGAGRPPLWGATAMILSGLVERLRAVLHST